MLTVCRAAHAAFLNKDTPRAMLLAGRWFGFARHEPQFRYRRGTLRAAVRTSWLEGAAWGKRVEPRHHAGDGFQLRAPQARRSAQQPFGIGMPRLAKHFRRW